MIGSIDNQRGLGQRRRQLITSASLFAPLGAAGINWGFALATPGRWPRSGRAPGRGSGPVRADRTSSASRSAAHILLNNSRVLLKTFEVPAQTRWWVYAAILVVTLAGLYIAADRAKKRGESTSDVTQDAMANS